MPIKKTLVVSIFILLVGCQSTLTPHTKKSYKSSETIRSSNEELNQVASLENGQFKYSVQDFFSRPNLSSFKFSPNGKYISYKKKDKDGKNHVFVEEIESKKAHMAIEEKDQQIAGYGWANNNRLVYVMDQGGDENYHLFSVDKFGGKSIDLTPYPGVQVSILESLKEQDDYLIISLNKDNPEVFEPFKINITNGELEKLYENTDLENFIDVYYFDKNAQLKAIVQQVDGTDNVLSYRETENQPFKKVVRTSWKDVFRVLDFNYATPYPHDAYVLSNLENDKREIILYDLAQNKMIAKVFTHPDFDAEDVSWSHKRNYELDSYSYNGIKQTVVPVSLTYHKWYKSFDKQFADKEVEIVSKTESEDKILIHVSSDKLFGVYYVYDTQKDNYKKLVDLKPELHEKDMAEMQAIKFIARDGLSVHAYLTLPSKSTQKKVPLIVNPHGGPYGERDSWGFNSESQLFASRGFATLQINYRGSGGYGKAFKQAGSKQIGRKMLEDLEDGVAYVKSLNLIDDKKIAIYGASYGGLATLGSLVKTPDLYVCGVDYVGVSNLFTFFDSFPPYWKPYLKQVYEQWYNPNLAEDKLIMKQVSPALNVDKITKPLFVVQGANDPRVKMSESDQIVKNLRKRGFDVPYMVKDNEGHGFAHEDNRIELYQTMLGFFAKHLK